MEIPGHADAMEYAKLTGILYRRITRHLLAYRAIDSSKADALCADVAYLWTMTGHGF